jgi:hypothetical protein
LLDDPPTRRQDECGHAEVAHLSPPRIGGALNEILGLFVQPESEPFDTAGRVLHGLGLLAWHRVCSLFEYQLSYDVRHIDKQFRTRTKLLSMTHSSTSAIGTMSGRPEVIAEPFGADAAHLHARRLRAQSSNLMLRGGILTPPSARRSRRALPSGRCGKRPGGSAFLTGQDGSLRCRTVAELVDGEGPWPSTGCEAAPGLTDYWIHPRLFRSGIPAGIHARIRAVTPSALRYPLARAMTDEPSNTSVRARSIATA